MKITHSTKVKASEERPWYVVDYKIPDDPESIKRDERRRIQRELADEEDAYDLEHGEGIYSSDVTCADDDYITDSYGRKVHAPKPVGGDGENYISYYTGHGYAGPKEILEDAKKRGFSKIFWGSDEAYGMKGMYNGDTYIAYNDAEVLPEGYREDALDAEKGDRVLSCSVIEGATQEEMQAALEEYQKKQQALMQQLDNLQEDQLKRSNKRRRFFRSASAAECHKTGETEDTIKYVVGSDEVAGTKWMGTYLTTDGQLKKIYFVCNTEDWDEASDKLEDIIPQAYQSCKLLGKAPDNIKSDPSFTFVKGSIPVDDVNSGIIEELKRDLGNEIHRFMVDVAGFDEEDDPNDKYSMGADHFWRIDVKEVEQDGYKGIYIEVGAELGYDSTEKLLERLDDIIKEYDKDAYFEPYDPGISVCYLWADGDDVKSNTSVEAASPVSDTREHYLEPEEDDMRTEDAVEQWIYVDIDVDIDIADDGSYEYDSYDFAKSDASDGDYYVEYDKLDGRVRLRDFMTVVEDIDTLLAYKLPDITGKHHISGQAELCYSVSGLVYSPKDDLVYGDNVDVTFDLAKSTIKHFKID